MSAAATTERPGGEGFLERRFQLAARGTSARIEALGGVATFLTMSYILFVNPAILAAAGMPFAAVAVATALAAAITTAAMGLFTNLPFALAPGLGINAIVAFDIVLGRRLPWEVGMSVVVLEGVLALILVIVGLREAGIVINDPATGIGLGDLTHGPALIALGGIAVAAVLATLNVRGSVILGVFAATALGLIFGVLEAPDGIVDMPGSGDFSTIGDALAPDNLGDALQVALIPVIFALFMTDFFDTIGSAVAVGRSAGLVDEHGHLPNTQQLLLVDSGAAALGGAMGCSSVTTYVESGAGVAEGARTGLASLVTAGLFALAIFFVPVIALVGQAVPITEDVMGSPAITPALVMVGYLMIRIVGDIDWSRPEDALPAFLVIAGIPMTFSIAAGIGLGVLGYVLVMLARGRRGQIHPLMWVIAVLFVCFFAADWLEANVF